MIKRRVSIGGALAAAAGAGIAIAFVAGCSHIQPSLGEAAIVTGHGSLSTQQVIDVVPPGQSVNQGNGTTSWYFPAQVRNYVTAQSNGDRDNPAAVLTGKGPDKEPGMPDYVWTRITFMVNPAIQLRDQRLNLATKFLAHCLKYGCATTTAQNDNSNQNNERSSTLGWRDMLGEDWPQAIDNATGTAIGQFDPGLWTQRDKWPALASAIQKALPAELAITSGATVNLPYYCGPNSTTTVCNPIGVLVTGVTPVDPSVQKAYQQQLDAVYLKQSGAARLSAAKEVYGQYAQWFLGVQDTESKCPQGSTCNFYLGNPPPALPGK